VLDGFVGLSGKSRIAVRVRASICVTLFAIRANSQKTDLVSPAKNATPSQAMTTSELGTTQALWRRWMSPDPSMESAILELPQTWNKHSYEYNRPLYGTDPDGGCPPCIGAIICGVVEGGFDLGKQL
jgi:hypothetical protein